MRLKWFIGPACLLAAAMFVACGGSGSSNYSAPAAAAATAPSITTQPGNASAAAGSTAMFTVVASGTDPLTYQWQKNGTAISGATGASYTTPVLAATDDG